MSKELNHVALANKSHRTLELLLSHPTDHAEWIVTVAFYKALHIVEAVFCQRRVLANGHDKRLELLKTYYPSIYKHYRPLWQASSVARYLYDRDTRTTYSTFADYLPPDKVVEKMVFRRLRPIEQEAVGHLSEAARASLLRFSSTTVANQSDSQDVAT